MKITSAEFMRGVDGTDELLSDGTPQVALIGRSNVGKSSIINSLTGQKNLARTSHIPGLTQQINIYKINHSVYLLDLPGYGYAKVSHEVRDHLRKLISWYLSDAAHNQKITMLVMDANIGPTESDLEMLSALREHGKNIVVIANKVDKIKKSEYENHLAVFSTLVGVRKVIPYSSEKGIGIEELSREIFAAEHPATNPLVQHN